MKILIACEFSGIVREEFKKRGHDAWSCDLLPTEIPGNHYQGDIRGIIDDMWDILIAFPPCTHLAVSGARWFPEKRLDGRQQKGIDLFMILACADINQIAIENPIGIMSTEYRKPDQIVQPWQFGDAYKKSTCLWLKNLNILHSTNVVKPKYVIYNSKKTKNKQSKYSHFGKLGKGKGKERSVTPIGLAKAMAEQWGQER